MRKTLRALKKILLMYLLFCSFFVNFLTVNAEAGERYQDVKHVLFISSYNENFLSVPDEIEGIKSVLEPDNIVVDIEYMDTKRFYTNESLELFYQQLKYKIDNMDKYDAIIVGDDNALKFAMDYQDNLFYQIPIIFFGINDLERAKEADSNPYITGIVENTSIKENIELGQKFNPKATKVVAIVDNTLTGKGDKEQFYDLENDFEHLYFGDINTSEYTIEELKSIFEQIDDKTILIYLSMYTDKDGVNITIPEAVKILADHTHVPIYRAEVGGVGQGVLGGKMVSYLETGKLAANLVLKILNGASMESMHMITESPNQYIFDYELLKQYKIKENLLPKDAVFVNKKSSFYEENRQLVLNTLLLLSFLVFVLIILFIDNMKRRKVEKELQLSHEELTQTFEELTASEEELRAQYDTIEKHAGEISLLNQKYSIAIESTESAVWEYDILNDEVYISDNFMREFSAERINSRDNHSIILSLLSDSSKEKLIREFHDYQNGRRNDINVKILVNDNNNCIRWILVRGKGVKDSEGNLDIIHGILLDITKMKEQEEYIEYHASHDYLTKLPNRMDFMNKIREDLHQNKSGAILMLDIDNFKGVNDTLGHLYGDKMLQEISDRLSTLIEDDMFISRFGGDEFLVLISNKTEIETIEEYVVRIMQQFEEPFILDRKEYFVKFSIGITCFPKDSDNIDQLLMHVDTAMYNVKKTGKNNYMFYNNMMLDEIIDNSEIETILRSALKNDGFALAYQPQVNVDSGKVVSFEALLRLKEYQISPAKFITIAEETGLIVDIGRWVTLEAIRQLADWRDKGYERKPVAINFSSKQIKDVNYIDFLKESLNEYQVEPKYLEIEITESILLEKTDLTLTFLAQLKEMGMHIALDDFGTGYSSLNYLTFIPVDKIKLDKSLCEKFLGMESIAVMNSLISLVHSLKLVITAEGIEDINQYDRLKSGGCDYIQGYLFSKPLFKEDVDKIYNYNFTDRIV